MAFRFQRKITNNADFWSTLLHIVYAIGQQMEIINILHICIVSSVIIYYTIIHN